MANYFDLDLGSHVITLWVFFLLHSPRGRLRLVIHINPHAIIAICKQLLLSSNQAVTIKCSGHLLGLLIFVSFRLRSCNQFALVFVHNVILGLTQQVGTIVEFNADVYDVRLLLLL